MNPMIVNIILAVEFFFVVASISPLVFKMLRLAMALDISMDVKFRQYDNKTVTFVVDGITLGTVSFTGTYGWIHFNVFTVLPLFRLIDLSGCFWICIHGCIIYFQIFY